MKLYSKPGACSTADHIVLEWAGQPYATEIVDAQRLKSPEFLALNPAGSVPVLVDGDFVLTQNAAILGYIADSTPESGLVGDGSPRQRAEAMRWIAFVNSDLHPAFKPLFGPGMFMHGSEHYDTVKQVARARVRKLFESADARLGVTGNWLAGFRSGADAYLFVTLLWADKVGVDLSGLSHLDAFRQRMLADAAVQKVLEAEGLA